eukprot:TRINITY_DN43396_c0_g1_i1.p1 TRINITY_DN43396_c0_g1~~TRINITY_DN43396_c0_g1_i1.p1  ORF type:complete len:300 (+),score=68.11 TRINITY_DN43396_c0_g1_i1:132-902(+)
MRAAVSTTRRVIFRRGATHGLHFAEPAACLRLQRPCCTVSIGSSSRRSQPEPASSGILGSLDGLWDAASFMKPAAAVGAPQETVHRERCLLGWPEHQVYSLVADVDSYSDFLPWCKQSVVTSEQKCGGEVVAMEAEITAGLLFIRETFTSAVRLNPPSESGSRIRAELIGASIVQSLTCDWVFTPAGPHGESTEVEFQVSFCFRSPMHQEATRLVLSQVVETMVSSFEQRARSTCGPPRHDRRPLSTAPLCKPLAC